MKTRRIVLVDLYWTRDKDPRVPLGHASLLASLAREADVEVVPLVRAVNLGELSCADLSDAILSACKGFPAERVDVALGAYVWAEGLLKLLLPALRQAGFAGRIFLGGPQVSYQGGGLEALYPDADAFIRGYGEEALCAIARTSDRVDVEGVHWAGTDDLRRTARPNLERLPSPWLEGLIPLDGQSFIRWETQRGCPFRCAFCQHREPGERLKRKSLSLSRVQREIDLFCAAGVRDIAVLDPIFNAGPHAVEVLERFAEREYAGRLSLQCRAEMVTPEFLEAASRLDVRLEFGLQTIHDSEGVAVDRRNNLPKVTEKLAAVRARGLDHEVSLIFGLPEQTLGSFRESVDWCLRQRVPVIKAFPLLLLRGTPLDRDRMRWALRTSECEMGMVISSQSFSSSDWKRMAQLSDALRATEGAHPPNIRALESMILLDGDPAIERWTPFTEGGTA